MLHAKHVVNALMSLSTSMSALHLCHTDFPLHLSHLDTYKACRYAFLIDSNGLIRWRGSGKAEPAEVDSLLKAADLLLK